MPRLYIEEYTRVLAGKSVGIACREGILRDHFDIIVNDIKFLSRQGINTTLFHNIANRFANQKHFRILAERLPHTKIVRIPTGTDFYQIVLGYRALNKLIFLERKFLTDRSGRRLNAIDTHRVRDSWDQFGNLIANASFRPAMEKICQQIDTGKLERVHILPIRKHTIKHELFTVEGTGTLIANNFQEMFAPLSGYGDEQLVVAILKLYQTDGYLKPRKKAYITDHQHRFFTTRIDGIVVGCVELIPVDSQTAELGALAISTRFRGQRVGVFTVNAFIVEARHQGYQKIISLTKNPRLQSLFSRLGFVLQTTDCYVERQALSPSTPMYMKLIHNQ